MSIAIIGIDCAVEDKNIGLALASFDGHEARIERVPGEPKEGPVVEIVANWIKQHPTALLALDAPLGWPKGLRQALRGHKAGKPIRLKADPIFKPKEENAMFRRTTDELVGRKYKRPLDVGANLIARTAYAALESLHKLRARTGQQIPLAWKPEDVKSGTWAIEVYPAATLKVHLGKKRCAEVQGYKKNNQQKARLLIVDQLEQHHLRGARKFPRLLENDDALDAAICVLAGVDFLRGDVLEPKDAGVSMEIAKKEGWIWVKKLSSTPDT